MTIIAVHLILPPDNYVSNSFLFLWLVLGVFINEFMTVEMKEAFPNFPMNFLLYCLR